MNLGRFSQNIIVSVELTCMHPSCVVIVGWTKSGKRKIPLYV